MTIQQLETDYLVIGAGAMGMAFVDTMLSESDADFIIVDRHHQPGGHWNDAYPFVRLHQPSAFYGVASTELGANRIDRAGPNEGFYELASGAEVSAYFDEVMRERFLPSGRVRYFPMSDYAEDGEFRSLLSPSRYEVEVRKKIVDSTFFNTSVPSTHERKFTVDAGVRCVTPNELPRAAVDHRKFTILGAGKTGMDVAVWLLESGAEPDSIRWICPRDSWLLNRATTQPGSTFAKQAAEGFAAQVEAMAAAESLDDLFARLESAGVLLRIDESAWPTMFHYATISQGEVDRLRRIQDVVRRGRVSQIHAEELVMQDGSTIATDPETLYIDCTATAVQFKGARTEPVFADGVITLQALRAPLVATSAALTGFIEATFDDDEEKNRYCQPVALADTPAEWVMSFLGNMQNQGVWAKQPKIRAWMARCRLDPARRMPNDAPPNEAASGAIKARIGEAIGPAIVNLQRILQPPAAAR